MTFTTKLIVSFITIATAVVSGIWGGFEVLDHRMDSKVAKGEEKVMTYITGMKSARDEEIKGINTTFHAEIGGLKTQLTSIDANVRVLIQMGKRVELENGNGQRYTEIEKRNPNKEESL